MLRHLTGAGPAGMVAPPPDRGFRIFVQLQVSAPSAQVVLPHEAYSSTYYFNSAK